MAISCFLVLSHVLIVAFAQFSINSQTCVDPSGFESCSSNAQTGGGQCQRGCNMFSTSEICVQACGCDYFTQGINCALTYCWNQVYSCGYQALAIGTLQVCDYSLPKSPIPYFPAPPNAPGGCSCNIGAAYESIVGYNYLSPLCAQKFGIGSSDISCTCCAASGILSSFSDICPEENTNGIPGYLNPSQFTATVPAIWGVEGCDLAFPAATCTASPYGFPAPIQAVTSQFYALGAVPTPGTKSISNNPGGLSDPISGDVLTWTIDGATNVVTAVKSTGTSGTTKLTRPWMLAGLALSVFVMICLR